MFTKIAFAMIGAALIAYLLDKLSDSLIKFRKKTPKKIDRQE